MRRLLIVALALNAISAVLFIWFVKYPVYDDPYNIVDVHNYAVHGVSIESLLAQRNPPGPTGFIWMAAGVRLLRGDELRDARIAAFCSWALLSVAVLAGSRLGELQNVWYGGLLAVLVFPHAVEATATVLTEGPALLFGVLGALLWISFVLDTSLTVQGILGGLFMGFAVTCRQYYLALLPAAGLFACLQWKSVGAKKDFRSWCKILLPLFPAILPVVVMVIIWGGISSPLIASGVSYNHMWKATAGVNFTRPFVAAFYVALYFVPLTFPVLFRLKRRQRWTVFLMGTAGGIVTSHFILVLLQPGPVNSLVRITSRLDGVSGRVLFALLCIVAVSNLIAVCLFSWDSRHTLAQCAPAVFSLLFIGLFVAEQVGVGGNLPFYDRYILQIAPFMGLFAFALVPDLTARRISALISLSVLSHYMLWRYVLIS